MFQNFVLHREQWFFDPLWVHSEVNTCICIWKVYMTNYLSVCNTHRREKCGIELRFFIVPAIIKAKFGCQMQQVQTKFSGLWTINYKFYSSRVTSLISCIMTLNFSNPISIMCSTYCCINLYKPCISGDSCGIFNDKYTS